MKSLKRIFCFLLAIMILAGCTPAPAVPPESTLEVSNQPAASKESRTLTVLAAASLIESFTEIGNLFETQNPGVKVVFSFAGSQQLAQQLEQGIRVDVFASANQKYMDAAVAAQRVDSAKVENFAKNQLVVIYPAENQAGISTLLDLARPGIKLDLAAAEVPVGKYSLEFLNKASNDPGFLPTYKDDVLKNVVSYEDNVKSVFTKVLLGEADAGIVYTSDISKKDAGDIGRLEIPKDLNALATYPIAPVADAENFELARTFVDLVLSEQGQAVLADYGFIPVTGQTASSGGFIVTDALGRNVQFNSVPKRIVLIGKGLFMVADAIYLFPEAGKNIAALGSTNQGTGNFIPVIDSTYSDKISLDSNAGPEQIAAAQPDCVIMKSINAEKFGTPLEVLNIPVVYLDFETSEQYQRDLKTLGQLFQNPERAEELTAFYENNEALIAKSVSGLKEDEKPRTLLLYYSEKDGAIAFNVPPMSWMQAYIIQTAGGNPVWQDANPTNGWTKVGLEQIAAWDPDVIFVVSYSKPINDVVAQLKSDSNWQTLKAVKNEKLFGFATDLYSWDQPDVRWILGLKWAAGRLHPEIFNDLDIVKEAMSFYKDLYGMDDEAFQNNILPVLTGDIN